MKYRIYRVKNPGCQRAFADGNKIGLPALTVLEDKDVQANPATYHQISFGMIDDQPGVMAALMEQTISKQILPGDILVLKGRGLGGAWLLNRRTKCTSSVEDMPEFYEAVMGETQRRWEAKQGINPDKPKPEPKKPLKMAPKTPPKQEPAPEPDPQDMEPWRYPTPNIPTRKWLRNVLRDLMQKEKRVNIYINNGYGFNNVSVKTVEGDYIEVQPNSKKAWIVPIHAISSISEYAAKETEADD